MARFLEDLTIIYLTANLLPKRWVDYQQKTLLEAIEGFPVISVAPKFGLARGDLIIDTEPKSHLNMYKQMLKAAKRATTKYIAAAEDDALYPQDHFTYYRPSENAVSYNMSRWSLYTWNPVFSIKQRISNCTLIADRLYWIDAWEERLAKFPGDTMPIHRVSEVGRNNQERWMGVTERRVERFWSGVPVIHLNHDNGTDSTEHRKKLGEHRALEVPVWGRSEDIVGIYNEGVGSRG